MCLATWLRRTGGVILACLMLCLSLAPAIDSLVCSADTPAVAEMHGDAMATANSSTPDKGHDDGGAPCLHGHCHHGSAALPALQQADATVAFAGPRHPADRGRAPTVGRQFEMFRPPIA